MHRWQEAGGQAKLSEVSGDSRRVFLMFDNFFFFLFPVVNGFLIVNFFLLTMLRACNNWEKAEQILSMMKSRAIKPNEVTYTELISICGRSGDVHQALVSRNAQTP